MQLLSLCLQWGHVSRPLFFWIRCLTAINIYANSYSFLNHFTMFTVLMWLSRGRTILHVGGIIRLLLGWWALGADRG